MLGTLFLFALQGPGEDQRMFALGSKEAYLMLAPEVASAAEAQGMTWTADGSCLVVKRQSVGGSPADFGKALIAGGKPPADLMARLQPKFELVVYSVATRRSRAVLSVPAEQAVAQELRPMVGTDRMVFSTFQRFPATPNAPERYVSGVTMLAAGSGTLVRLSETVQGEPGDQEAQVELSPTRPLGMLVAPTLGGRAVKVRFFGPEGKPGPWLPAAFPRMEFDEAGNPGYPVTVEVAGKKRARFQRIDPATGKLGTIVDYVQTNVTPVASMSGAPPTGQTTAEAPRPEIKPALEVFNFNSAVASGPKVPGVMLAVQGGKPEEMGIVTTDGIQGFSHPSWTRSPTSTKAWRWSGRSSRYRARRSRRQGRPLFGRSL